MVVLVETSRKASLVIGDLLERRLCILTAKMLVSLFVRTNVENLTCFPFELYYPSLGFPGHQKLGPGDDGTR